MATGAQRRPRGVLFAACLATLAGFGRADAADKPDWKQEIAALERQAFDPVLTADEVDRLLGELKSREKRGAAARRLSERGQGHIERIVVFAHDCPDIEARQACADVVEALDSAYRTTSLGAQLAELYRQHTEELLPARWAAFRQNPLDPRAVAMLMSGDPETVYRLLGKSGDRRDTTRFLLLRIRELSPDKFAAEHLQEHTATGALLVLGDVFPCAAGRLGAQMFFGCQRIVGHSYLRAAQICSEDDLFQEPAERMYRTGRPIKAKGPLPRILQIELERRLVGVFAIPDESVCFWKVGTSEYRSPEAPKQFAQVPRLPVQFLGADEGLCPLPKFNLRPESIVRWRVTTPDLEVRPNTKLPWYLKPCVPLAYQADMQFVGRKPGENLPAITPARFAESGALLGKRTVRPAALLDPSAPAVVILPLRLAEAADSSARAAAELACDRLAEEIAAEGIARVLDRSQVDRVIEEKRLGGNVPKPVVAYDAMIRLEVDVPSLVPEVRMSLIDLSHGNVMKQSRSAWPMREDDLRRMVRDCGEGLKQVGRPEKGKLKIRCLEVASEEQSPRLAPLARRLQRLFDESVARSPQLVPVHHLEAATAKEESLLLLLGLSRLPGSRQFSPQADATVELHLREKDALGKTFEETPVEITARLIRGDAGGDQSFTAVATVTQFDRAAKETWQKVAGLLREARPDAAASWLDELAARRRQAEAELRVARAIGPAQHGTAEADQALRDRLAHVEAAVKLDPTLDEAAGDYFQAIKEACDRARHESTRARTAELAESILAQALRYFDRFGPRAKHRTAAHDACCVAIEAELGSLDSPGNLALTSRRLRMIQMAKLVFEEAVKYSAPTAGAFRRSMGSSDMSRPKSLTIVGRAMKRNGVPLADRTAWVDGILGQYAAAMPKIPEMDEKARRLVSQPNADPKARSAALEQQFARDIFQWEWDELRLRAADLAVEDAQMDRAWELVGQLRQRLGGLKLKPVMSPFPQGQQMTLRLRLVVLRMDDADRLAEFDRWAAGPAGKMVRGIYMQWPEVDIFANRADIVKGVIRHGPIPSVEGTVLRRFPETPRIGLRSISALVEGDGRLYVAVASDFRWQHNGSTLTTWSHAIGYVPLDGAGRPLGKAVRKAYRPAKPTDAEFWDTLKMLPEPELGKPLCVTDAKYVAGRLCLATSHGLLIFDPIAEKWSIYGPEQGLPEEGVEAIYPADEKTLFCAAGGYFNLTCYTVGLLDGKIRLLHRGASGLDDAIPRLFWRSGGKLWAWSRNGIYEDLLGPAVKFTEKHCDAPYGWSGCGGRLIVAHRNGIGGFIGFAEVAGRRFVTREGLHEFDPTGRIIENWWKESHVTIKRGYTAGVRVPQDCPINGDNMFLMGTLLVFTGFNLVVWDPRTDTWYGPLALPLDPVYGGGATATAATRGGVWLRTRDGMLFVSAEDLLSTAKSVGRAMTTAEYRRRQQETIALMPPLNQAQLAISTRQFDAAKRLIEQVLHDDPDNAKALLLMGNVHDLWCLDQPDEALKWYQRLADLKSNPDGSFSGMYERLNLLRNQERWPEALATIDEINATFAGRLARQSQVDLDHMRANILPLQKDGKQAPPATSNKEDRPQ